MSKRRVCLWCQEEFFSDKDEFHHLRKWGCPIMYKAFTEFFAPKCRCGCGNKVDISRRNPNQYNEYVKGHNKRPKE